LPYNVNVLMFKVAICQTLKRRIKPDLQRHMFWREKIFKL